MAPWTAPWRRGQERVLKGDESRLEEQTSLGRSCWRRSVTLYGACVIVYLGSQTIHLFLCSKLVSLRSRKVSLPCRVYNSIRLWLKIQQCSAHKWVLPVSVPEANANKSHPVFAVSTVRELRDRSAEGTEGPTCGGNWGTDLQRDPLSPPNPG